MPEPEDFSTNPATTDPETDDKNGERGQTTGSAGGPISEPGSGGSADDPAGNTGRA